MKTVYLHIGTHKTGTTFLQRVLFANREKLREAGFFYPKTGMQSEVLCGHHLLPWAIQPPEPYPGDRASIGEVWSKFRHEIDEQEADHVIASSEELCYLGRENIFKLRDLLLPYRVVVVVYLRRQDRFLESLYAEQTKKGSYKKPKQILLEQKERFDYYQLLNQWSDAFGRESLVVRVYEEAQLRGGLLADFLGILKVGVDDSAFELSRSRFNASINPRTIKIMRFLNLVFVAGLRLPLKTCRKLYAERLQYPRAQRVIDGIPGFLLSENVLSPGVARQVIAQFEIDNERIAREYLGRGSGELFLGDH